MANKLTHQSEARCLRLLASKTEACVVAELAGRRHTAESNKVVSREVTHVDAAAVGADDGATARAVDVVWRGVGANVDLIGALLKVRFDDRKAALRIRGRIRCNDWAVRHRGDDRLGRLVDASGRLLICVALLVRRRALVEEVDRGDDRRVAPCAGCAVDILPALDTTELWGTNRTRLARNKKGARVSQAVFGYPWWELLCACT